VPDALSRALAPALLHWATALPTPAHVLVVAVAQAAVFVAVALVIAGAWLAAPPGAPLERGRDAGWCLVPGFVAVVLALVIANLVGLAAPEARPFVELGGTPLFPHAADASFPSDHVSAGMALRAARVRSSAIQGLVVAVALSVGLARMLSGVHWLDDIVGGALLGLIVAWAVAVAWDRVMAETPALPSSR
jgi:undecaprenyl-diphosphatase